MVKNKNLLNVIISIFSQMIILALGLIVPRLVLTFYGSDTNGLTNTITQIFAYMALLEAGISQSARNALFNHVKNDDKESINRVLGAASYYYRKISYYYLLAVIILSIVMPFILKTNVAYFTIFGFILFEGLTKVVSFYFINTWTCFLMVNGKNYIINGVSLLNSILCYAIKIVLVINGVNIALIQVGYFAVSIVQLVIYYMYMRKKYSWVKIKKNTIDKLPDRNSYVVTEIAWTIFSSTDMIILSVFVSTTLSSVYSVYNMVFVAINALLNSVYTSLNYNLGIAYHTSIEKYKKTHDLFNSVFVGAMTLFMSISYLLIIPFVRLYTHGVQDVNYIYPILALLFCLVQLLSWSRYVSGNLTGLAGYAKTTSYISIIEALTNVSLSLLLVKRFNIVGVLLATVFALPLKVIFCNYISDYKVMKRAPWKTLRILFCNYSIFAVTVFIKHFLGEFPIDNFVQFIITGIILVVIYSIIITLINGLANSDVYLLLKNFLKKRKMV